MQTQNTKKLIDAIDHSVVERLAAGVPFTPLDVITPAIVGLTREARDEILIDLLTAAAERRMSRSPAVDSRQGWLALPEFERVPQLIHVEGGYVDVNDATLDQYRESEAELRERIRSYSYPRRSDAKLKRDKETLRQMRKLDKRVSPLMAGYPEMKMGPAIKMHLEAPAVEQRRKAGKARQRSTKNQ